MVVVTSLFSPFILNDVLVLVLTPVLVSYSKETGADVAPLLVAEITFTNIASSLTPIGNPQNLLLWQGSGVSAGEFVAGTWLRLLVSGGIAAALLFIFRRSGGRREKPLATVRTWGPAEYLVVVVTVVFGSDLLGYPNYVALRLAFVLGFAFTFRSIGSLAKEYDAKGLLILCSLVGVVALAGLLLASTLSPLVSPAASGVEPYTGEFFGLVSAVISNVPATQLVLSTSRVAPHTAPILAVDAGLAGNIDPISSLADLLALLTARRSGASTRRAILLQLVVGLAAFLPALV